MNYQWDERACGWHGPRPIPPTTRSNLGNRVTAGDTIRIGRRPPVRVLTLTDHVGIGARSVRAVCRLDDGVNEILVDLSVVGGHLMTRNHPGTDPGWLPVTLVHRPDRQLDMFGGAS